jgi:hypothetical protein
MRQLLRNAGVVAVCAVLVATCANAQWIEFQSEEAGFQAKFPSHPAHKSLTVKTASGPHELTTFTVSDKTITFSVTLTALPNNELESVGATVVLDGARDGAVANVQGVLLSELIIDLDGHPGRELTISAASGKAEIRQRLYLVGNRLYQLLAVTPNGESISPRVSRFFDSFKLL